MISSSDARWNVKNKMIIANKLKIMNSNIIENASDSGEEVDKGSCFLKDSTFTDLWITIANYVDRGIMIEKKMDGRIQSY